MDMKLKDVNIKKIFKPTPFLIMYPTGFVIFIFNEKQEWNAMSLLMLIIYFLISTLCLVFERVFAVASNASRTKVFVSEIIIILILLILLYN